MNFTVTSGNPTPEEMQALLQVLSNRKVVVHAPVIKRSNFGLPHIRQPLPHQVTSQVTSQVTFGARRFR